MIEGSWTLNKCLPNYNLQSSSLNDLREMGGMSEDIKFLYFIQSHVEL